MTTKICSKCGWELSIKDPAVFCPICHTRFTHGICSKCGEFVEYYRKDRRVCKHCYDTVVRTPKDHMQMKNRRRAMFTEWQELILKIPKSYPTLTEEQWIEAVKYFNGCAICGSESIDTRGYFIPFKYGGRYCNWNIIPMCEKCATNAKLTPGYFLVSRPVDMLKIIDYLEERINAALNRNADTKQ